MNKPPKRIVVAVGYPEFSTANGGIDNQITMLNKTRELVWKMHHPKLRKTDRYRLVLEKVEEPEVLPDDVGYPNVTLFSEV